MSNISKIIELPTMGEWDWEWSEFRSYYDPTARKFFWGEASGCSCSSFEELADWTFGSKTEFMRAVTEFGNDSQVDEVRRAVFSLKLGK